MPYSLVHLKNINCAPMTGGSVRNGQEDDGLYHRGVHRLVSDQINSYLYSSFSLKFVFE